MRRAVNDERLNTIAHYVSGPDTSTEWTIEGRRLIPLMPRLVPQTAFTATANAVASVQAARNAQLPPPSATGTRMADTSPPRYVKRRRLDSQTQLTMQGPPSIVPIKTTLSPSATLTPVPLVHITPQRAVLQNTVTVGASTVTTSAKNLIRTTMSQAHVSPIPIGVPSCSAGRVYFVSAPATTMGNLMSGTSKPATSLVPLVRQVVTAPRGPGPTAVRATGPRPAIVTPSVVSLQKQMARPMVTATASGVGKHIVTTGAGIPVAQAMAIRFPQGTKVFTKTGGQQQLVVFPVSQQSQKPIAIPVTSQAIIKSPTPSTYSSSSTSTASSPGSNSSINPQEESSTK